MPFNIHSILRPLILVIAAFIATTLTRQQPYLIGWSIGVLAAWLNYSALISSVRREKAEKNRNRLTFQFFWRYAVIGILLFALQVRGTNHLIGFLAGFAVSYASFLIEYLIRLRKPTVVR